MAGQQILCTCVGPVWKQCLLVIGCLFLYSDCFRTFYNMISTESTNIIHIIKQQYGESILSEARHLERTRIKYAKYTNHLRFSLRCYHNNLIPKDLQLKSRIKTSRSKQILDRASRPLLQERSDINHNRRNRLKINIDLQTQHLKSTHPQHFEELHNLHNKTYSREMVVTKERYLKRYTTLPTQDQQKQVAELQNQITIDKSKW